MKKYLLISVALATMNSNNSTIIRNHKIAIGVLSFFTASILTYFTANKLTQKYQVEKIRKNTIHAFLNYELLFYDQKKGLEGQKSDLDKIKEDSDKINKGSIQFNENLLSYCFTNRKMLIKNILSSNVIETPKGSNSQVQEVLQTVNNSKEIDDSEKVNDSKKFDNYLDDNFVIEMQDGSSCDKKFLYKFFEEMVYLLQKNNQLNANEIKNIDDISSIKKFQNMRTPLITSSITKKECSQFLINFKVNNH